MQSGPLEWRGTRCQTTGWIGHKPVFVVGFRIDRAHFVNNKVALRNVRKALVRNSEVGETLHFVPFFVFLGISPCVRDAVSIITVTLTLMSSIIITSITSRPTRTQTSCLFSIAHMSSRLAGKGGEILRAAATEVKDMDDDEVANLAAIYWNVSALDSALASSLITTTTGEVGTLVRRVLQAFPGSGLRAWQELNRWYRPKSAVEGAASMAGIIAPPRAKSIAELQRFIMDWELRVAEHEARHNE